MRWMLFVDGENFTIEGLKVAKAHGQELVVGTHYLPEAFLWIPSVIPTASIYANAYANVDRYAIRAHYYTTVTGDDPKINEVRKCLRELGFHPEVFRKPQGRTKSKGVDITLAKDMLSHCFHGNYDVAVLFAGDGDFVPLVNEVKRMGKPVFLSFFKHALNPELQLASDYFLDMEDFFLSKWKKYGPKLATPTDLDPVPRISTRPA